MLAAVFIPVFANIQLKYEIAWNPNADKVEQRYRKTR